ncbi:DUF6920 family protein [Salegentibacter sp. 24]|uniref:DUF6920 family protein n=1 Tax=Salegentibacter sp. 24 TaxID=2183986 RepID=UPI001FB7F55A|nr:DUF6544 family protein [Salegentibacter sp. 24]
MSKKKESKFHLQMNNQKSYIIFIVIKSLKNNKPPMRIALAILIGLHGVIHLFGFLKAFGIIEFNAIAQPISKSFGMLWLVAFILLSVTLSLLIINFRYWWIIGIAGVMLSQFLIFNYWNEAKFGTILNLIILACALIAFSTLNFQRKITAEIDQLLTQSQQPEKILVTEQMISTLPEAVQKWLLSSGIVGQELIQNIYLEQNIKMLMKPEQRKWTTARAKQYFTVDPPGFIWSVKLNIRPGISIVGRDKFVAGKGEMIIKLFSIFPIAKAQGSPKIDQSTLQRYLAEIVWFPSAATSSYITWEAIDEFSARATMNYKGTKASGVFYFDNHGNFKKFIAMRYKEASDLKPTKWIVSATKIEKRNGISIPVASKVSWKLDSGDWTWLKLEISELKYNCIK